MRVKKQAVGWGRSGSGTLWSMRISHADAWTGDSSARHRCLRAKQNHARLYKQQKRLMHMPMHTYRYKHTRTHTHTRAHIHSRPIFSRTLTVPPPRTPSHVRTCSACLTMDSRRVIWDACPLLASISRVSWLSLAYGDGTLSTPWLPESISNRCAVAYAWRSHSIGWGKVWAQGYSARKTTKPAQKGADTVGIAPPLSWLRILPFHSWMCAI